MATFCAAFAPGAPVEKIEIASVFHDLGIWTDGTFDYLPPSERLACDHLARIGRPEWAEEVAAMVNEHHRIRSSAYGGLVEAFRKADWTDVTHGALAFGLDRSVLRDVFARWPNAGFHAKLVRLELGWLRSHPTNPLPMVRF